MTAYMHICNSLIVCRIVKVAASLPMESLVETEIHVSVRQRDGRVGGRARAGDDVVGSESDSLYFSERAGLFTHA